MKRSYSVFIADAENYADCIRAALDWLNITETCRQSSSIFIKPNFTFPGFRPGITTTRELICAALEVFSDLNRHVMIGESDGGYGTFSAEEAFRVFDLYTIAGKYGCKVVDLGKVETVQRDIKTKKKVVSLNLPRFLLEDNCFIITLPVPKVHCFTGISLSYKNQWGCIPDMMRIRLHPYFDELIGPLNRLLNVGLSIVDGTYGLTKNGPIIEGEVVNPGWLLIGNNLAAVDRVASSLMGLNLESYSHYRKIRAQEEIPNLEDIAINEALEPYVSRVAKFYLKLNIWNYMARATWYSPKLGYFVYESKIGLLLHKMMYMFREKPKELKEYRPTRTPSDE